MSVVPPARRISSADKIPTDGLWITAKAILSELGIGKHNMSSGHKLLYRAYSAGFLADSLVVGPWSERWYRLVHHSFDPLKAWVAEKRLTGRFRA